MESQSTLSSFVSSSSITDPRELWIAVDHVANTYRKSQKSQIWDLGTEFVSIDGKTAAWKCSICETVVVLSNKSTSNATRHLRKKHRIMQADDEDEDKGAVATQAKSTDGAYHALVNRVDITQFRKLLVDWIVQDQLPLSSVKSTSFRAMLLCLQPSIERYLIKSHNTMRSWVVDEFEQARLLVKQRLALAKSKIHISFDLWTSPNAHAIVAVVAHFLSPELRLRHVLLAVREIEGSHSGENIADSLLKVISEYEVNTRLGVFVSDNASSNDVAVRTILSRLEIDDNSSHRARCLGHIINLAAQAFILGKDCEVFSINAEAAEVAANVDSSRLSTLQRIWRDKGPIGKYHNIVAFIRASPQRRQAFTDCIRRSDSEKDGKLTNTKIRARKLTNFKI